MPSTHREVDNAPDRGQAQLAGTGRRRRCRRGPEVVQYEGRHGRGQQHGVLVCVAAGQDVDDCVQRMRLDGGWDAPRRGYRV